MRYDGPMAWARVVAVVASLPLVSCGLLFPTDNLVAVDRAPPPGGDGGQDGGGGADGVAPPMGDGGGGLSIADAPNCTSNGAPNDSMSLAASGSDLHNVNDFFAGPHGATVSYQQSGMNKLDVTSYQGSGELHLTWTMPVAAGVPIVAQGTLTLPDGTPVCAGDGSQVEATSDNRGAIFLLHHITYGTNCPGPPSTAADGDVVGCVVFQ
jgi:hypothetical protein